MFFILQELWNLVYTLHSIRIKSSEVKVSISYSSILLSTSIFEHLLCARHYSGYRQHRSEQNRPKSWLSHGVCMLVGETDKKENK